MYKQALGSKCLMYFKGYASTTTKDKAEDSKYHPTTQFILQPAPLIQQDMLVQCFHFSVY